MANPSLRSNDPRQPWLTYYWGAWSELVRTDLPKSWKLAKKNGLIVATLVAMCMIFLRLHDSLVDLFTDENYALGRKPRGKRTWNTVVDRTILIRAVFELGALIWASNANWTNLIDCPLTWMVLFYLIYRVTFLVFNILLSGILIKFRYYRGTCWQSVHSTARSTLLGLLNYFELVIIFAFIYHAFLPYLSCSTRELDNLDPLYFSAITQFTIGYGDIVPIEGLRWVVMAQEAIGLLITLVFVSRLVGSLGILTGNVERENHA